MDAPSFILGMMMMMMYILIISLETDA